MGRGGIHVGMTIDYLRSETWSKENRVYTYNTTALAVNSITLVILLPSLASLRAQDSAIAAGLI